MKQINIKQKIQADLYDWEWLRLSDPLHRLLYMHLDNKIYRKLWNYKLAVRWTIQS